MDTNYCKELDTFIFKTSWTAFFLRLTDEDAGALIKAISTHAQGGSASEYLRSNNNKDLETIARAIVKELETSAERYIGNKKRLAAEKAAIEAAKNDR